MGCRLFGGEGFGGNAEFNSYLLTRLLWGPHLGQAWGMLAHKHWSSRLRASPPRNLRTALLDLGALAEGCRHYVMMARSNQEVTGG